MWPSTARRRVGIRSTSPITAGWQENGHSSYGLHLGTVKERMDRFEEAVEVICPN